MASRFRFPSSGASPTPSQSFRGGWSQTGSANRYPLEYLGTRGNTGNNTSTLGGGTDQALETLLRAQWASPQLVGQTIQVQTVKAQFQALEDNALNDLFLYIYVGVCNGAGTTLRGTLVSLTADNLELNLTTAQNRGFSTTCSEVVMLDGDRIVVEVGHGGDNQAGGSHNGAVKIGVNSAGADLAENDTDTTASNVDPWLEFVTDTFSIFTPPTHRYFKKTLLRPSIFTPGRAL